MFLDLLLFSAGVAMLLGGAWLLITGGSRLAVLFGVAPVVIGLTIVAFGTSAPELFVSLVAALRGSGGLMMGNVVGSNVANLGLILGLAAVFAPVTIEPGLTRREIPLLLGVSLLFVVLGWDSRLTRVEGALLTALFAAFMILTLRGARSSRLGEAAPAFLAPGTRLRRATGPLPVLENRATQPAATVPPPGSGSKTMEGKTVPSLYFIGEVLDVTGWLGGYNFQWAWSSGWCAGHRKTGTRPCPPSVAGHGYSRLPMPPSPGV
ncbi:MAG: NAD(P)/FAD-dependent oxidoreductase, partial [Candidatus Krumholzibacteriia bacterium]